MRLHFFLFSQMLSLFAEEMIRFCIPIIFFVKTGNAFGSSILFCCSLTPRILAGSLLGYLSDRFPPKMVFRSVLLGQAVLISLLPFLTSWLGFLDLWIWGAVAVSFSILNSVQYGAVQKLMPQLWDSKRLVGANGLLVALESTVLLTAPLTAGILLEYFNFFYICCIAAAINVIALCFQSRVQPRKEARPDAADEHWTNAWLSGWLFISRSREARINLVFTAPVNFLLSICLAALVPTILITSQGQTGLLGLIMSLGALGQFLGGLSCQYVSSALSTDRLLSLGFILAACGLMVMGGVPLIPGSILGFFVMGFGISLLNAANQTAWQQMCPEHLRSRVISTRRSVNSVLAPLGFLVAIPYASLLGGFSDWLGISSAYPLVYFSCGIALLSLGIGRTLFTKGGSTIYDIN